ncbi:MAG: HTH domain-containing protein [Nitrosarchaeum sp.]|nr:HTH domain-containing protein [Nitrosarchaeum sp.]
MARRQLKLYGKKVTSDDILLEINNLLYAKGQRPMPLRPAEIAKALGISRKTVYNYIAKLSKTGKIIRLRSGHFFLPKSDDREYYEFNKHHIITSDPLVSEWMDDLLTRKQGMPLKSWKSRLRSFETVCNTCKVTPYDLTISNKKTEKIMRSFAKHFQNGDVVCSKIGRKNLGMNTIVYKKVQAVRDFCSFYDITWRKGISGVMSQKVPHHGKYAYIRFTQEEFEAADLFIKERWGLDSDIFRWFWIGIESCARFGALYNMKNDWTEIKSKSDNRVFLMSVIESKTDNIRGGKWTKFITRTNTQKSLELLKSRKCDRIFESNLPEYSFRLKIHKELSEIYNHLGKHDSYFQHHPSHALRHLGAHYWLSKTNYNYGIIAEVGGWHTIDELKKSYGQIPPEKILEIME